MFRHVLPLALPLTLSLLVGACGNDETVQQSIRPAMVVQPQPAGDAMVTYPGEVRARLEPELAFRIGGKITRRLVEVGDRVKAEQPLAELDPQDVRLQLEASRAQVAAAEANLKLVRAERDRYKTLLDRKLISQSQFDNVENQYRSGEARVKQIQAEYNVASNQAGYAVLRASQNGVIATRRAEVGQVVAAGQTVFTLAADGEREVLISLPEHAIDRFKIGQAVAVELWSQPDKRFPGRIRELAGRRPAVAHLRRAHRLHRRRGARRTGPERPRVHPGQRRGAALGAALGAHRRSRCALRLGGEPGQLEDRTPPRARRSLRRGPGAGARRPEARGLGGRRRCPGAARRPGSPPVDRANRAVKLIAKE